jgi:hypothetical protein
MTDRFEDTERGWTVYIDTMLMLLEEIGVGKLSDSDCKAMLRLILLANKHRKAAVQLSDGAGQLVTALEPLAVPAEIGPVGAAAGPRISAPSPARVDENPAEQEKSSTVAAERWEWTSARDDVLRDRWPTLTLLGDVEAALRGLPGDAGPAHLISNRANALGLRRPEGFAAFAGKAGAERQWERQRAKPPAAEPPPAAWRTKEREAVMRRLYPTAEGMAEVDDAVNALDGGKVERTWLYTWANELGLRRPLVPKGSHTHGKPAAAALNGSLLPADFQQIEHWAAARGIEFRGDNLPEVNARRQKLGLVPFELKRGAGERAQPRER